MTYILDAGALIAFLKKEPGKEKVWDIFQEAENETASVYMNAVNLIEVYYQFIRDLGKEQAAEILNQIYNLPLQIVDTINNLALKGEVCCSPEVLPTGFNTFLNRPKGRGIKPLSTKKQSSD
jgi:predicted nucleic acid-binding protein